MIESGPDTGKLANALEENNIHEKEREYIEIMASLRHYSSLRFAVISVFYAVTAALIVGSFGLKQITDLEKPLTILFKFVGIIATLVCFIYDFMIDGYQAAFRKYLITIWPKSHWFKRPKYGRFFQIPIWVLYLFFLVFWISATALDQNLTILVNRR